MAIRIFSEYLDTLKANAIHRKQEELLASMKKRDLNKEYLQGLVGRGDHSEIVDVKLVEDGSIRTYTKGYKEPMRIYVDNDIARVIAFYKRLIPLILENLSTQNWISRFITILSIKNNLNILDRWFESLFINYALIKDEHWSQPTKEVLRVLRGKLPENVIYAIILIIEYDTAYRYRFQDIIVHYNRNKDVTHEIIRLFDLLISRELEQYKVQMGNKWKRIKVFVKIALFLQPKLKKQIKEAMDSINLDEVKMSREDLYWTDQFGWYNYRGLTQEQRKHE